MPSHSKTISTVFFLLTASLSGLIAQADLNNSIYVPVEPCRVGDTRPAKVTDGTSVEWLAYGDDMSSQGGAGVPGCPQPKTGMKPIGVALNVTVVGNQATGNGNVVAYPADGATPSASLVNYKPGTNIANSTIVGLCQDVACDGKFKIQSNLSDVPVVADVQGFFYPAAGNIANVALSGGDYTSPVDAMADVASWCGIPAEINQCLVKIAPGTYDLGSSQIVMQEWVSIQGSGQETTNITGAVGIGNFDATSAVVVGKRNAALTDLAVVNTGGSTYSIAIFNQTDWPQIERVTLTGSGGISGSYGIVNLSASPTMVDVTAVASGGTSNIGVFNTSTSSPLMTNVTATGSGGNNGTGVHNTNSSSPTMTNVTATGSGVSKSYGVWNSSSSPTMTNVTATATGGSLFSNGVDISSSSSPFIQDSVLEGSKKGLNMDTVSTGARVVNSKIIGGVNDGPDTTTNCLGNYKADLADVIC